MNYCELWHDYSQNAPDISNLAKYFFVSRSSYNSFYFTMIGTKVIKALSFSSRIVRLKIRACHGDTYSNL